MLPGAVAGAVAGIAAESKIGEACPLCLASAKGANGASSCSYRLHTRGRVGQMSRGWQVHADEDLRERLGMAPIPAIRSRLPYRDIAHRAQH